jgi:hypothetical protein
VFRSHNCIQNQTQRAELILLALAVQAAIATGDATELMVTCGPWLPPARISVSLAGGAACGGAGPLGVTCVAGRSSTY